MTKEDRGLIVGITLMLFLLLIALGCYAMSHYFIDKADEIHICIGKAKHCTDSLESNYLLLSGFSFFTCILLVVTGVTIIGRNLFMLRRNAKNRKNIRYLSLGEVASSVRKSVKPPKFLKRNKNAVAAKGKGKKDEGVEVLTLDDDDDDDVTDLSDDNIINLSVEGENLDVDEDVDIIK